MGQGTVCIGVMSGTSVDGIDVAIVHIVEDGTVPLAVNLLHFATYPYTEEQRKLIFRLFQVNESSSESVCDMNIVLGEWFAKAVLTAIAESNIDIARVALVSSHGQTIFHKPNLHVVGDRTIRSTLQLGESAIIAERTGLPVVSDFRVRDIAAGGQGAPLVPYVDELLFSSETEGRIAANIGGIANLTFLPPRRHGAALIAFDTGPGNMIIDGLVRFYTKGHQAFDTDGGLAQLGTVNQSYLERWLGESYFRKSPPKTTGRELFGDQCVAEWLRDGEDLGLTPSDVVATATAFTVQSFALAVQQFILPYHSVSDIYIGGGGANNPVMITGLQRALPNQRIVRQDETGISCDAKEAVAFAVLGYQCFHRKPNNVPSATGAHRPVSMGKITWP